MTETNETLVETNSLNIQFEGHIDKEGNLKLSYDGTDLSRYEGRFEVECDTDETVTFSLAEFTDDNGTRWALSGDRRLPKRDPDADLSGPWTTDQVVGNMSVAQEIGITATAESSSKTQTIYVKTKPRTSEPDWQLQGHG